MEAVRIYSASIVAEFDGVEWVAYCPAFDVVSQAESPAKAIKMIHQAVSYVIENCLNSNMVPQCDAPDEVWEKMDRVLKGGKPVPVSQIKSGGYRAFSVELHWRFELVQKVTVSLENRAAPRRARMVMETPKPAASVACA
jgi:predicted RNase H-like HicB family nuclease